MFEIMDHRYTDIRSIDKKMVTITLFYQAIKSWVNLLEGGELSILDP